MKVVDNNSAGLKQIVELIKNGGVAVFPTDTSYGVGGVFDSPAVIDRILKIKKRRDKKFVVICSGLQEAKKVFVLDKIVRKLAQQYWPGPLSIAVGDCYAIRVPDNELVRKLVKMVGRPIIATSANLSGREPIYESKLVLNEFKNKKNQPDLLLDAGKLKKNPVSTLIQVKNGEIEVLRKGSLKISM